MIDVANNWQIWVMDTPAFLKIGIGVSQVLAIIELTIRVEQSQIALSDLTSEDSSSGRVEAKHKKFEIVVVLMRILSVFICLVVSVFSMVTNITVQVRGMRDDKLIEYRI